MPTLIYQVSFLPFWFHPILQNIEPTFLEPATVVFIQNAIPDLLQRLGTCDEYPGTCDEYLEWHLGLDPTQSSAVIF